LKVLECGFVQESLYGTVKPFDFTFGLRAVWLREKELYAQLCTGTFHPLVAELAAVIKVQAQRATFFDDGFFETVLNDDLFKVIVKLCVNYKAGGIVNKSGKVNFLLFAIYLDCGAKLNISLPQVVTVTSLKTPGGYASFLIEPHMPHTVTPFHQLVLEGAFLDYAFGCFPFQLQNFYDGGYASPWYFPAQEYCRLDYFLCKRLFLGVGFWGRAKPLKAMLFVGFYPTL
jgi:hypothetical protein